MKLSKLKLENVFKFNRFVLLLQIKNPSSKQFLDIKKKLYKQKIGIKYVSKNCIKHIMSSLINCNLHQIFKSEMFVLCSNLVDCVNMFNRSKMILAKLNLLVLFCENRFFQILDTRKKDFSLKDILGVMYCDYYLLNVLLLKDQVLLTYIVAIFVIEFLDISTILHDQKI